MKKRTGILLTSLSLILFASCGCSKTSKSSVTSTEISEVTTDTKDPKEEYQSFRKKIQTMGDNITKMPTGAEFFQCDTDMKAERHYSYDYTNPGSHYSEEPEFLTEYGGYWSYLDEFRENCMHIRDLVLSEVTQLDTLVRLDAVRGMLSYDELADEIHITYTNDLFVYEITSGYTKDQKAKITAACYSWHFMEDDSSRGLMVYQVLHYIEDTECVYIYTDEYAQNDGTYSHRYNMMLESDPISHEIKESRHFIIKDGNSNRNYVDTAIQKKTDNGRVIVKYGSEYNQYDIENYDEDGHLLLSYTEGTHKSVLIPLFALDGWDTATSESEDDVTLTVTINGSEYSGSKYYGDYYIKFYKNLYGYDYIPLVSVSDFSVHDLDYSMALNLLNENFGLTPKREITSDVSEIFSSYKEIAKNSSVFGVTDITSFTPAVFESVYERYDYHTLSYDQVEEIVLREAISPKDQEYSYADTGYLNMEVSGDAEFNSENLTLNLKNVKLTVKASALLSDTLDYQAFLLLHGNNTEIIASGTATRFDKKNDLVLGFSDEEISVIEDSLKEGEDEYVLELVVGTTAFGNFNRLSNTTLLSIPKGTFKEAYTIPGKTLEYKNTDGTVSKVTTYRNLTITPADDSASFHIMVSGVKEEV